MDEPLSNLDAKLRVSTRTQIAELQSRLGVTTLYVTHDQVEAMTMGDRVAVIDGVLQQVDVPRALYDSPINAFVAGFIGSPAMNLLDATIVENGVQIGSTVVALPSKFHQTVGKGPVTVGLRPEAMELAGDGNGIAAVVKLVEELGSRRRTSMPKWPTRRARARPSLQRSSCESPRQWWSRAATGSLCASRMTRCCFLTPSREYGSRDSESSSHTRQALGDPSWVLAGEGRARAAIDDGIDTAIRRSLVA